MDDMTNRERVVVASANPVKVAAIQGGLELTFPERCFAIQGVSVESGVSDQPMSDEETLAGARNRTSAARSLFPDADIWCGLEGGVQRHGDGMFAFAWIVCETSELRGEARTATFPLPPGVVQLIDDGVELGDADDRVFGRANSKQKEGAVGILTGGLIDRCRLYEHAAVMALIPLRNTELFRRFC